jgi:uncharacterized delta-60 repeat protein
MARAPARRTRPPLALKRRPLRSVAVLVAVIAAGLVVSTGAKAAPGDLDLTFSSDGKQQTGFGFGLSEAAATVRQPDGKVVAVGTDRGHGSSGNGSIDFALARYKPNGLLDTSFSADGKQTTGFGNGGQGFAEATGVALQGDGKIVVVGHAGFSDFALTRYNPNGSLDTSFSGDGKQTTDFFGASDQANGVAIQANGKIVAVGQTSFGDFALARYNPNGSLDTGFSGDGRQMTDFFGSYDQANGVAIQSNGKIVAVGGATAVGSPDFALARYNPNGSLDTGFSGDGKQTLDFGSDFDNQATGVALQANGTIVVVGDYYYGQGFGLARYNPNGSLDTSFSGDGKQTTDFGGAGATGVALQGDGKIVAVGGGAGDFALARYKPNGLLDTSFSADGKQTTDFFANDDVATEVALQGDGKIVVVGRASRTAGVGFALARYNPNGSLDTTFSGDGKQTTNFGGGDDLANGVALQGDGKIVAVGFTGGVATPSGGNDFALVRYNADGSVDTTFSGDGRQTTDFGGLDNATGVAIQADGKIVVVGRAGRSNFADDFALSRYNPNGSLDTSFSGDGKQTTTFGGLGEADGATGVAIQGNGKIVVVGNGSDGSYFALARYNPNGSLDTSFSGDGKQATAFVGGAESGANEATGVALQGDGKIVAVGRAGDFAVGAVDFALARYNPNGSLDTSFSGDGKQTTTFSVGGFEGATGVALQGDGQIIAVGNDGGGDFALARYNGNGSLDTTFSGDGKQTTDFGFGAPDDLANGVALQGDGKIVAVGVAGGGATGSDFALARYNPNGSLDTSFSADGRRRTNFGPADGASGVAVQGDGNIVAVGVAGGGPTGYDFALARYIGG